MVSPGQDGHAAKILQNGGPLIIKQIPWEVRSAVILADPAAKAVSLIPWDETCYLAVSVQPDDGISWWLITRNDEKEWEIAPVRADWQNGGILVG